MNRWQHARMAVAMASIVWLLHPQSLRSVPQQGATTFRQLAEKAKKASEESRLDDAVVLYHKALALQPKWKDGWWSLGTIKYDRDDYAKAAQAFEKLVALDSRNGTAHAMLGLCQFELGRDEPALKNLTAADRLGILKNEELRKVAVYHLGLLQLRVGRFGAAQQSLAQLGRDGIQTKELYLALGEAALLIRPKDAPPENAEGYGVLQRVGEAEALLAAKQFYGARQIYSGLVEEYPAYPNLHFAFGRFLLEAHDSDLAVEEFQKELHRDPKNVNSLLEIAAVRYLVDSADGVKYAEEAVKLDPQRPLGHYLLGLLYSDTQNYAGAVAQLEIAKSTHPNVAEIYFALGKAYARLGRKQEAAQARAIFQRLNEQADKVSPQDVYGLRSSDLDPGKLGQDKN